MIQADESPLRHTYIILLPGGLILLVALGDDALLLLDRGQVALDDVVEVFADRVLHVHLVVHYLRRYPLLDAC